MGSYRATIRWSVGDGDFAANRYSRGHRWEFDGGLDVPASASPSIVALPLSVAEAVDPEEAFVASLASCHMLFFLAFAARDGLTVDAYVDEAEGFLGKGADGKMAMTRVVLHPAATYGGSPPGRDVVERLHNEAHDACFIANSVRTPIVIDIIS